MARSARITELRKNLRLIYSDAVTFSVMVGAGETYLAAFVLALGMGEIAAGLIASIPMLAGAVLQLISPAVVRKLKSHRKWVVICAIAQGASFIPLVIVALAGHTHVAVVFAIAALYWGAGMAAGATWNTWVGTLVPRSIRAHYFARRSRGSHFSVLVGLISAGLLLQFADSTHDRSRTLLAFAALFSVSGICRFVSSTMLARQTEPVPPAAHHREVPWRELLGRFRHGHDGRLLVYMLAVQVAIQISGPYFTPFMLGQLKMSYAQYLLLIATSYTARIFMLPILGGWVRRAGARRVLWFSGFAVIPLSAIWMVSDSILYLFFVQLIAGAVWAAYELTTFLLLFETIREEERTSVLTTFNLANAIAIVCGAALGAAMLRVLGTNHAAYMAIFAVSCFARLFTIALLVRTTRAVQEPHELIEPVPTTVMAVRPNLGSIERPILSGISTPTGTADLTERPVSVP